MASVPVATFAAPPSQVARTVAVRLDGLTKSFPVRRTWREVTRRPRGGERTPVVRGVSAEIRAGEFFGLLGPNGAGKTTLFKILSTLVTPDAGTATVAGFDVVREPAQVRRVLSPVIADERSLNWRLSARENLRLFAALYGLRRADARNQAEELLHVVALEDVGEKLVGSYSSGMRQRLLIARALLSRPQVLLLDEPTRSLDPISAREFRRFLRDEISGRRGCTVLLATHITEEAFELCDRVAVLDRGRVLAAGPTDNLVREFGDERYHLWVKDPTRTGITGAVARGLVRGVRVLGTDEDDWTRVEVEIPGGLESAAAVTSLLARAGVPVARFERTTPSLADLIERIVACRGGEVDGA